MTLFWKQQNADRSRHWTFHVNDAGNHMQTLRNQKFWSIPDRKHFTFLAVCASPSRIFADRDQVEGYVILNYACRLYEVEALFPGWYVDMHRGPSYLAIDYLKIVNNSQPIERRGLLTYAEFGECPPRFVGGYGDTNLGPRQDREHEDNEEMRLMRATLGPQMLARVPDEDEEVTLVLTDEDEPLQDPDAPEWWLTLDSGEDEDVIMNNAQDDEPQPGPNI